jgi:hypothetical protein
MKKKYLALMAVALTIMSSPAISGGCDGDDFDKTNAIARFQLQLGMVLGSETACGLTYDQDAIEAFINKQPIGENDPQFVSDLAIMSRAASRDIEEMSKGVLAAHCTQTRRVAKQNGFIK